MMNKMPLLLVAATVATSLSAVECQTVRLMDVEKDLADYVRATNAAGVACAEWARLERDWRAALRKDRNAPKPEALATKPTQPQWLPCPLVWPEAELRKAKPRDRAFPRPGEECGLKANDGVRGHERLRLPVALRHAGTYHFWIRHWRTENRRTALEFLLRNPDGECVKYELTDRFFDLWEDTHASNRVFSTVAPQGWVWTKVAVDVEYPGDYQVWLGRETSYVQRNLNAPASVFAVRDVWATDDLAADPNRAPLVARDVPERLDVPAGFVRAAYNAPHVSLNSSIPDPEKRPATQLVECYSWFSDPARYLKYGVTDAFNVDDPVGKEAIRRGDVLKHKGHQGGYVIGGSITLNADASARVARELAAKYPFDPKKPVGPGNEPVGRMQLQDGSWGGFSDSFEEFLVRYEDENEKDAAKLMADKDRYDNAFCWWTAWEQCGSYDYGPTSVAAYRRYLAGKYGDVATLNAAWRTEYAAFDDVKPGYWKYIYGEERLADPLEWHRNAANFIDFRAFCSRAYANRVGCKTRGLRRVDPKKHVSSNLSANNISSVMWMQWRPLIFEDTAQITMKGSDMIGYDNYGTDDLYGATYEIFDCFGDGCLRPMVREGAIHAASPELQARSQWHNVAKGMQGQACFCTQEANVGELSKFGMTDMFHGATPRPKIAAFADNFRALHQLEYLVSEAKRTRAVKPVAIYYSATCFLMNEQPYASIFDCGPDNFFRVYELLHANGYDVTFVTDRQIREGGEWFKGLGAIMMIDATYVPLDVQDKLIAWVKEGGALFADAQSGSCDDHTYPTDKFVEFLGIRPVQQKKVDAMAAEKLAFGYSAYSFDVIQRDRLYKTSCEVKDAPGGTHPISRMLDKTMFSAMGYNEIKCVKGTQVMQENNGRPYMVVRNEGKGTVCYFAGYLGTAYGAGCTKYEWTDAHADDSPYRVVDAWAKWAGLEKIAVNDLPDDLGYGVRVEAPLVDAKGNAMLGIVSQLRTSVPSFRVRYRMPANFKAPKVVLGSVNASRALVELPFSYDETTRELSVRMCPFRCWGNILALNDSLPYVSLEAVGATRDAYSLAWIRPGEEVTYRARVYNPSATPLAGAVELRLPDGWFYDRGSADVGTVPAFGASDAVTFRVKAPAFNSCRKLEPVNAIFRGAGVKSSPAVEMVWFQKEPQLKAKPEFGVR